MTVSRDIRMALKAVNLRFRYNTQNRTNKREMFFLQLYRTGIVNYDAAIFHFVKKRVCKIYTFREQRNERNETTSERVTTCRRFANAYMFLTCVCAFNIMVSTVEINIDCRCVIIELI